MPDLGGRGSGAFVVGCSLVVLIVGMLRPWDPDAAGGIGFPIACAIAVVVALVIGNQSESGTGLPRGALVGSLAAIAFVVGTFVAYDQLARCFVGRFRRV